jgi:hypothetical protein
MDPQFDTKTCESIKMSTKKREVLEKRAKDSLNTTIKYLLEDPDNVSLSCSIVINSKIDAQWLSKLLDDEGISCMIEELKCDILPCKNHDEYAHWCEDCNHECTSECAVIKYKIYVCICDLELCDFSQCKENAKKLDYDLFKRGIRSMKKQNIQKRVDKLFNDEFISVMAYHPGHDLHSCLLPIGTTQAEQLVDYIKTNEISCTYKKSDCKHNCLTENCFKDGTCFHSHNDHKERCGYESFMFTICICDKKDCTFSVCRSASKIRSEENSLKSMIRKKRTQYSLILQPKTPPGGIYL